MTTIDPELLQYVRNAAYQEFKLASSGHEGPIKRPEGVVLVVPGVFGNLVPVGGHTKKGYSATGDALNSLRVFMGSEAFAKSPPPVVFALAAVGLATERASIMKLSPRFLKDLRAYPGAAELKTIDVFAPHGDKSYDYSLKLGG